MPPPLLNCSGSGADASPVLMTSPDAVAPTEQAATDGDVVVLDRVVRTFGDQTALDGLSFTVPARSITVLLGPNGAGKTTCTRVVTGALGPDSGQVRVFGLDNLRYAAELYGLGRGDAARRCIDDATERFGISGALDQQVGGYSTGMKTRLALARSVLHDPDLVLYDEPTSGLDPESSYAVLELIREMTAAGDTVIMCTHLLLEAEGLADQVVMLQDGRSLVQGPPAELVRRYWPDHTVLIDAEHRPALLHLVGEPGVVDVRLDGDGPATVVVDDPGRTPELVFALARHGVRVTRVESERHTLEDLYFAVRRTSGENRIGEVHA
jgi:ABC-2 type transport system ATP-binding protein